MLSLGRFTLGMLELAVVIGAAWVGASALRTRLVPTWSGLVTWLADAVIALSLLVVVGEALGTFGLFREWIVVITFVALGSGLRFVLLVPAKHIRIARTRKSLGWDGFAAIVPIAAKTRIPA